MKNMWAVDLTHTSHSRAATGIQQVCRTISAVLEETTENCPVVYDRFARRWRLPDATERDNLSIKNSRQLSAKRGPQWSSWQKIRGFLSRPASSTNMKYTGLLIPEIFEESRWNVIKRLGEEIPKVAIVYDTIPLRFPNHTPLRTVQRFPEYLRELSELTHIVSISESTRTDLIEFWDKQNISRQPPVTAIPLGIPDNKIPNEKGENVLSVPEVFKLLIVGTLEARKNHLSLLKACKQLWDAGQPVSLTVVGMLNKETGEDAYRFLRSLESDGYPITYKGPLSEDALKSSYENADCVVYPSIYEGYGLPVVEALAYGKPVIATSNGALSELIHEGGCLETGESPERIAQSITHLIQNPELYLKLLKESQQRKIRSMSAFVKDLGSLMNDII